MNYSPPIKRSGLDFSEGVLERRQQDLVMRAKAGDSDAFARLYDDFADRIYRFMFFQVGNEEAAEDLTARVFLLAWRNLDCYSSGRPPFTAWLYLLARNAVEEYARECKDPSILKEILAEPEQKPAFEGSTADCPEAIRSRSWTRRSPVSWMWPGSCIISIVTRWAGSLAAETHIP